MKELMDTIMVNINLSENVEVLIGSIAFLIVAVLYFRNKSIEDIRSDVYEAFLRLEHEITGTKAGRQRLEEAVDAAYDMLPAVVRIFISKKSLEKTVDKWFKQIKELLDDGKDEPLIEEPKEDIREEIQTEEDMKDLDGDI